MPPQLPYRFITGLPPRAQQEIWRDFEYLIKNQAPSATVFDAYVDPTIASDSPATRTFRTPFTAIAYCRETLGQSVISIGWRNTSASSNTATEIANYPGVNSVTYVSITVIGAANTYVTGIFPPAQPTWALGTFTAALLPNMELTGLHVTVGANSASSPIGATALSARSCYFQGVSGGTSTGFALATGAYLDCRFNQCTFLNQSGGFLLQDCVWEGQTLTSVQAPARFMAYNTRFESANSAATTWTTGATWFIAANCSWSGANASGGTFLMSSSAAFLYLTGPGLVGFGFASSTSLRLTINAGNSDNVLQGEFHSITAGSVTALSINAATRGGIVDITGPANVNLDLQQPANFLRGTGISGSIRVSCTSGTALSFVGVTQAALVVAFRNSSTAKAYAIDAASGPGIMIETGESGGSTPSTNLSATFLVINQAGAPPSGAAGGRLAGTFPNPTLANSGVTAATYGDATHYPVVAISADGTISTASNQLAPGAEVAIASFTADVSINVTTEATPVDVVSLGAITYTAVKHRIEFYCPDAVNANAGQNLVLNLWDGATNLGIISVLGQASGNDLPVTGIAYITPTAGSHTYKIRGWNTGGAGVSLVRAGTGGAGNRMAGTIRATIA